MVAYATKLGTVQWIKQPDSTGGLAYSTPRSFATSGAGAAGGTTVVAATLATLGSANDDYVGHVIECTSGAAANVGLRRRVLSYDDVTGTLTVKAFPAQVTSGDTFNHYLPPHPFIVAEAATSAAGTIDDADRNEAADLYNTKAYAGGPYLYCVAADSVTTSTQVTISDFTTGSLTPGSNLSGGINIGDYFEIWMNPEITNATQIEVTAPVIERQSLIGEFGKPASLPGIRDGSGAPELAFRGPGTAQIGGQAEAHELLSCVFDATEVADSTASAGCTTTSFAYSAGNHSVGDIVVTEHGEAAMVTADSGSAYTVSPAVTTAPTSTDSLYGCQVYKPADELNAALAVKQWRGKSIVEYLWGCAPQVAFAGTRNEWLKITATLMAADWLREGSSGTELQRPYVPKLSNITPKRCGDMRVILNSVSWNLRSFTFDPGFDMQMRANLAAPNETDGYEVVNSNPTGSLEVFYDSSTRASLDQFLNGKEVEMLLQSGSAPGSPGIFVIWANKVRYTGPTIGDDAGQLFLTLPFEVNRHETTALPQYEIAIC